MVLDGGQTQHPQYHPLNNRCDSLFMDEWQLNLPMLVGLGFFKPIIMSRFSVFPVGFGSKKYSKKLISIDFRAMSKFLRLLVP